MPDIFDEVADIGHDFLERSRSHKTLQNYTTLLGTFCTLIKKTHSIVVDKLEALDKVTSLAEAQHVASQLEDIPLSDIFRASGLCDVFVGFGISLRKLAEPTHHPDGTEEPSPLRDEKRGAWLHFCDSLEEREQEVAGLYAYEIQQLGDLAHTAQTTDDLDVLKAAAQSARNHLTAQMADFGSLANKFLPG